MPHCCLLVLLCGFTCVQAQEKITIVLKNDRPLLVDEVQESRVGYLYKRGNITTLLERERVVRVEYPKPPAPEGETAPAPPAAVNSRWRLADAQKIQDFFLARFKKPMPTTAFGQSHLHTRWGLDHRNSMDVNLHPDSVEGRALVAFLRAESIPFLVFRGPIPGVATGPHIHVGNRSSRSYGR